MTEFAEARGSSGAEASEIFEPDVDRRPNQMRLL
jgi:hypothetical protein